ncbi:MAG: tetratricopeptide repeat protein [Cyanosarcina radialis HA8281-LM2]|jgi:tetratricopeptide (TPR) repeat protein|nr:tetratricopeptide repeat protein [Cyanosarcina radialis HA8281-LM2]
MRKYKTLAFLSIPATAFLTFGSAYAQTLVQPPIIVPMPQPDVCGGYSDDWSANCRRDRNGNMVDGNTGNVYDPNGNLIRRGGQRPSRESQRGGKKPSSQSQIGCNPSRQTPPEMTQLGIGLHQAGKYQAAIDCYNETLKIRSDFTAYQNRGLILYEMGKTEEALLSWRAAFRILKQYPPNTPNLDAMKAENYLSSVVGLYQIKPDRTKARQIIDAALELDNRLKNTNFLRQNLWGNRLISDTQALLSSL